MEDKFKMTVEQNIFLAKRNIVDYIWKSARLEGLNVTFPETYAIYEKSKVKNADIDTIVTIINLKRGWKYVLNNINEKLDLNYFCAINAEISRDESLDWGNLRTGQIGIGGTDYVPPIPQRDKASNELNKLLSIQSPTERAIEVMLWGMKAQLFWDGNKRTSMLVANKIMIENGCGIISVPNDKISEFNVALSNYYSNDTINAMKEFVYDNCIDGVVFEIANMTTMKEIDNKIG